MRWRFSVLAPAHQLLSTDGFYMTDRMRNNPLLMPDALIGRRLIKKEYLTE